MLDTTTKFDVQVHFDDRTLVKPQGFQMVEGKLTKQCDTEELEFVIMGGQLLYPLQSAKTCELNFPTVNLPLNKISTNAEASS